MQERRFTLSLFVCLFCQLFSSQAIHAQEHEDFAVASLKNLSIEELLNIEVTTVSKRPEKLSEVASAIQVITGEDIRRSGATSIPEALRLASNLQVAQLNATSWIISARGFNTVFANKLLVLIDGRTVYTPLFGGVLWELQHVLLEDVDRIEVISGPGGLLWGANAVNGVINIITRQTSDTQGLFATAATGDFLKKSAAVRYGAQAGENFSWRVYGQHQQRDETDLPDGNPNTDGWGISQGGFRMEYYPTVGDHLTVQGDVYTGKRSTTPEKSSFDGQNLMARWTKDISGRSALTVQLYYDRYWRDDHVGIADELQTYDVDLQHQFFAGEKHNLIWGAGYRLVKDEVVNRGIVVGLDPQRRTMPVYSGFIQDEIALMDDLKLTLGTKVLHNIFSGFELQPGARIAWNMNQRNTVWSAVSRAVRAPSRLDVDYYLPLQRQPPGIPSVAGGPDFDSEKLHAFEIGYRFQTNSKSSFSLATFYNDYNDVYSVETLPGTLTYQIQNGSEAETWGAELSGVYQLASWWRVRGGFTYFDKDLRARPGRSHDPSYLMNDAKHYLVLQSLVDLPANFKVDVVARYADYIPQTFATVRVNEYFTFNARVAWEYKQFVLSVVGQNLYRHQHAEFGAIEIPRSVYGKVTCRF